MKMSYGEEKTDGYTRAAVQRNESAVLLRQADDKMAILE